jgi:phage shock protein PspC (stress-responsive transcriptional regulator)
MKKTIQIHIGGRQFHMDEDAYDKLNHYLESLKAHFRPEGASGKEIVEDIEQRIAELLENKITDTKQSISLEDVAEIINTLGNIEDFVYTGESAEPSGSEDYERRQYRRFYRDPDNNYLGGVAAGMGAYFDIDPLWIRLAFVGLCFLKGLGFLIYIILWIVVPKARNTAEKLRMRGVPVNLATIRESVDAEYRKVKAGLKNLKNSTAAERTRSVLENLFRAFGLLLVAFFKFIIIFIGIVFLVTGVVVLSALIMVMLGTTGFFGTVTAWHGIDIPHLADFFTSPTHYYLMVVTLILLVLIPIVVLIYEGVKIVFNVHTRHRVLRAFVLTTWILSLILFVTLLIMNTTTYAVEASGDEVYQIEPTKSNRYLIQVNDNARGRKMTIYSVFNYRFRYSDWDETLFYPPKLNIEPSSDKNFSLIVKKKVRNTGPKQSPWYLDRLEYNWEQKDSVLYLDRYFKTDDEDFWLFGEMNLTLKIPEGEVLVLSEPVCDLLRDDNRTRYCEDSLFVGKSCIMTAEGLTLLAGQKKATGRNK